MSERKSWSSTVVGWFVERPEEEAAPEPDPAAEEGQSSGEPSAPPAPVFVAPVPAAPGGRVDFPGVYTAAGIDVEEQARVQKAIELLSKLPADTDPALKQQIVSASLNAFGVPIEKIIEGAVQEVQALDAYLTTDSGDARKVLEESQNRIAKYEEEIQRIKTVMSERVAEKQAVVEACNGAKLEIQRVLEFFGRDAVARVVRDSAKLIDPNQRKA